MPTPGRPPEPSQLTDAELHQLRGAFLQAGYTVDGAVSALSTAGQEGLARGEIVPALRAATGTDPCSTLVRLFVLGSAEPAERVAAALRPVPLSRLVNAGVLVPGSGELVSAGFDIRPYGAPELPWYVASDVTPVGPGRRRPLRPDHVLGVGGASLTLAGALPRRTVATALDLGTGCGVQALHLTPLASRVTATDANPRALALSRLTAVLSGQPVPELLLGNLFEPVAERGFDLVVSNPPFVLGPHARFAYRDSGLPADEIGQRVVRGAATRLADGGVAVVLGNWLHVEGEDWRDRVRGWVSGLGCAALVLQREVQDPAQYAELWLRDSGDADAADGPDYEARYAAWLDWFDEQRAVGVGFGVVLLHRSALDRRLSLIEARHEVEGPLAGTFERWLEAAPLLGSEDALLRAVLTPTDLDLVAHRRLTTAGWEAAGQRLTQSSGLRRSAAADDVTAALVAGCGHGLPVTAVLDLLAAGYGADRDRALDVVRGLLEDGYLVAATDARVGPGSGTRP